MEGFAVFFFAALFFVAGRFAARFLIAGRLAADFFFVALRFAGRAFFVERFADDVRLVRRFDALRLLAFLLPDFLRDFLARAAMTLLLGVGDDGNALRIAGTEHIGKAAPADDRLRRMRCDTPSAAFGLASSSRQGQGRFFEYGRPKTSANADVASSARTTASRCSPAMIVFA
jgi:hypothetical protein